MSRWKTAFGNSYTKRNVVDPNLRVAAFRKMLEGISGLRRVLELGCNRGHNLVALRTILGAAVELVGIEPNPQALQLARQSGQFTVLKGDARQLLFPDRAFDLVFTAGVLIHIPPDSLILVLREVARISARYVLSIEYFAEADMEIPYRGENGLLWKRNYLAHFQSAVPGLVLRKCGYWGQEDGFDRCHWWLLEKSDADVLTT